MLKQKEGLSKDTLIDFFTHTFEKYPLKAAYIYEGREFSYKKTYRLVCVLIEQLKNTGVKKGDKIIISLPNIVELPVAILACLSLGAVCVMSNPMYTSQEVSTQIDNSGAKIYIGLDIVIKKLQLADNPKLIKIFHTSIIRFLPISKSILAFIFKRKLYEKINCSKCEKMINTSAHCVIDQVDIDLNDLAVLLYTGGTTGKQKAVEITHGNISSNIQQIEKAFPEYRQGSETILGTFPFFTGSGFTALMALGIYKAATIILLPRPNSQQLIEKTRKFKPTVFPAVPTLYNGLIEDKSFYKNIKYFTKVKYFISGAAPLNQSVSYTWKKYLNKTITELYGLSETTAMSHANPIGSEKIGSVGLPLFNTNCKVVNEVNKECVVNETGEVCIQGPQVARKYYMDSSETKKIFKKGFLYTGDLGYIDNDGFLFLTGRKKDLIIASGYNIYPQEIDTILIQHSNILESFTVGIQDDYRGETVKSFIVLRDKKKKLTLDEIAAFCKNYLAPYKIPKVISIIDNLPRNTLGKVIKNDLND